MKTEKTINVVFSIIVIVISAICLLPYIGVELPLKGVSVSILYGIALLLITVKELFSSTLSTTVWTVVAVVIMVCYFAAKDGVRFGLPVEVFLREIVLPVLSLIYGIRSLIRSLNEYQY